MKLVKDEKGHKYALKVMKADSKKTTEQDKLVFLNEVSAMMDLDHPNIIRLIDYSNKAEAVRSDGSKLKLKYIALEYCEGGELFDYIAETGRFSEKQARFYFHQLIDALEHMHKIGYKHRDIKPENILLDKNFNLKLADFGFATKEDVSYTRKGTFGYMAPEVLAYEPYRGEEADIFSAAIVLFILVTQHPPFIRADAADRYYKKIWEGKWDQFWDVHADLILSESFIDLFSKMVSPDPKNRLSIAEIKAHEWYTGSVPAPKEIIKDFIKRQKIVKRKRMDKASKSPEKKKKPAVDPKKSKIPVEHKKPFNIIDTVIECAKQKVPTCEKYKERLRAELNFKLNPVK